MENAQVSVSSDRAIVNGDALERVRPTTRRMLNTVYRACLVA